MGIQKRGALYCLADDNLSEASDDLAVTAVNAAAAVGDLLHFGLSIPKSFLSLKRSQDYNKNSLYIE